MTEVLDASKATDVMFDIETLGVKPGCIVLSAAALKFNRHKDFHEGEAYIDLIENGFAKRVSFSLSRQMHLGLQADQSTMDWYFNKNVGMLSEIERSGASTVDLKVTLLELNEFFTEVQNESGKDCCIWANSPTFDIEIIKVLYEKCGVKFPFSYGRCMDVRTIRDSYQMMFGETPKPDRNKAHDPVYDCVYQTELLQRYWTNVRALMWKCSTLESSDKPPVMSNM